MVNEKWKIMIFVIMSFFLVGTASAELSFDNVKSFDSKIGKYGKITIKDNFGLADLYEAELKTNTDVCAESCSAETEIVLHQTTSLIDEVRFMTQLDSGEKEEAIRSYQFYIQTGGTNITVDDYDWVSIGKHGNGSDILEWQKVGSHIESAPEWTPYTLGTEMSAGTYQVKLEGKKKPSRTVDWQITTQGKLIDEWALWGGSLIDGNLLTALPLNGTEGSTAFPDYASSSADAPHTWTSTGGAHINTSLADPWGNNDGVARFNQSNFISAPDSDDWDCSGGANCTIDAWVYVHTLPPSGADSLWGQEDGTTGDWFTYIYNDGRFTTGISGVRELNSPAGVISAGQWYHLAIVKDDGTTKTYVDGLEQASGALEYFTASTEIMRLGGTPNQLANVSISMFRFSNVSRWTQNFTPPGPFGSGQGEITLDSPVNNYVNTEFSVEFNCSATAGTGATVSNISLWHNGTGTWHRNQTIPAFLVSVGQDNSTGYWPFDESSGLNVEDKVGTNDLTVSSANWVTGLINNAFDPNGGESVLSGLDDTAATTINVWVNRTGTRAASHSLLRTGNGNANGEWIIDINSGENWVLGVYDSVSSKSEVFSSALGEWEMLTLVINTTHMYAYQNATLIGSNALSGYDYTGGDHAIHFFSDGGAGQQIDNMLVDEVGVWNKALNQIEIDELWNNGNGKDFSGAGATTESVSFTATLTNPTLWSCSATDSDNDEGFALENRTITFDTENPTITIFSPTSNIDYGYTGFNQSLNFSVTDDGTLSSCWFTYNDTSVNNTISCTTNSSFLLGNYTDKTLTLWANDTVGNEANSTISWNYSIWENSKVFNTTVWELEGVGNSINVTANSSLTSAGIVWDGTSYAATQSGEIWTSSFAIPEGTGSKQFYWNFTFGGNNIQSPTTNVTVNSTQLALCNASLTTQFINFTFKDEATDTAMDALVDSSTWTYWMGDSGTSKTLNFANTSGTNTNYPFCFTPPQNTMNVDLTFKYSNSTHPQRTYSLDDQALTNSTTNQVLYLLGSDDGIYSSINVIKSTGNVIEGVVITAERQVSSVWITVGQVTTGDDGLATFWVNPNFPHRFTAVKTGYITSQVTITPSQSLYTLTMTAVGGGTGSYNNTISGVEWVVFPGSGTINNISQSFNATVTASATLENCKLELLNASNLAVLASSTSLTNSSYCQPIFTYTPTHNQKYFGRLSVDTTTTDGWVIVDSDWKWVTVDQDAVKTWRGIKSFFTSLTEISDLGEGVEGEFSRFVLFFLITTIFLGAFFYFSGAELGNPGMSMLLVTIVVLVASAGNFLKFESGGDNISDFVEQWGFFIFILWVNLAYILNIWRKHNTGFTT